MRILIACEESDEVRSRFEKMGFDAWSCDIQPNRNPKAKHYQCDIFEVIDKGWDAMLAFPPCTDLAVSGSRWFEEKIKDGRQQKSIEFFIKIANAHIKHIAIENPIGIMSKNFRKPDQIIQPYYFGDEAQKTTCLWLKNFPKLYHNQAPNLFDDKITHVSKGDFIIHASGKKKPKWYAEAFKLKKDERSKIRSKTFPGIAEAMAEQWGKYLINQYEYNHR